MEAKSIEVNSACPVMTEMVNLTNDTSYCRKIQFPYESVQFFIEMITE